MEGHTSKNNFFICNSWEIVSPVKNMAVYIDVISSEDPFKSGRYGNNFVVRVFFFFLMTAKNQIKKQIQNVTSINICLTLFLS